MKALDLIFQYLKEKNYVVHPLNIKHGDISAIYIHIDYSHHFIKLHDRGNDIIDCDYSNTKTKKFIISSPTFFQELEERIKLMKEGWEKSMFDIRLKKVVFNFNFNLEAAEKLSMEIHQFEENGGELPPDEDLLWSMLTSKIQSAYDD